MNLNSFNDIKKPAGIPIMLDIIVEKKLTLRETKTISRSSGFSEKIRNTADLILSNKNDIRNKIPVGDIRSKGDT